MIGPSITTHVIPISNHCMSTTTSSSLPPLTITTACPCVTAYGVEIVQLLGPSSSSDCLARLSCYSALKELIVTEVANT